MALRLVEETELYERELRFEAVGSLVSEAGVEVMRRGLFAWRQASPPGTCALAVEHSDGEVFGVHWMLLETVLAEDVDRFQADEDWDDPWTECVWVLATVDYSSTPAQAFRRFMEAFEFDDGLILGVNARWARERPAPEAAPPRTTPRRIARVVRE